MKDQPPAASKSDSASNSDRPGRRALRPRFSVGALLLAMFVFSVLGTGMYYGGRAIQSGMRFETILVIVAVCAPAVLLLTLKFAHAALLWINRDVDDRE